MDYDNTNRGVLFKNDRKEKDTHPDYKGSVDVDGTEFWLSAWIKDGKNGKFMSLSIKPKEEQRAPESRAAKPPQRQQTKPAPASSGFDDMDSDIPFITSSMFYDITTSKQRRMRRHDF